MPRVKTNNMAHDIGSSNLVEHADREMKLAGLHLKDADYDGELYNAVMELIKVFAAQGHSGFSAGKTVAIFWLLARFKNLEPIGITKDEWVDVAETMGRPVWQNKRNFSLFSEDAGETWYNVNDPQRRIHKKGEPENWKPEPITE